MINFLYYFMILNLYNFGDGHKAMINLFPNYYLCILSNPVIFYVVPEMHRPRLQLPD
jgi:hypothetical protein